MTKGKTKEGVIAALLADTPMPGENAEFTIPALYKEKYASERWHDKLDASDLTAEEKKDVLRKRLRRSLGID